MDIILRNLNASAVKIVDDKAKQNDTTRNQYLKNHIEELAMTEGLLQKENEINSTLSKTTDAMELVYKRMEDLEYRNTQMLYLLCDITDTEPEHLNYLVERGNNN